MYKEEPAKVNTPQEMSGEILNVNELRTNDLLRKDEWTALDTAVIEVQRQRLNGIADLQNRGLTRDLGGLGVLIDQYEKMSDMGDADVDMSGEAEGDEDTVGFELASVPIPIVHKGYRINKRRLEASRKMGQALETTQAEVSSRKVRDMSENILFNGSSSIVVNGNNLYGYTTQPNRITGSVTAAWTNESSRDILADVEGMLSDADAQFFFGPFILYVPTSYWSVLRSDYKSYSERTFLERLRQYSEIADVKPADVLPADNIVMVQMTRDVVDLAIGQSVTNVQWASGSKMTQFFKVMAAWAPRIKSDYNGNCGVVHYTTE